MYDFIKQKILDWCLSSKTTTIGDLYHQYQSIETERYNGEELKFIEESIPEDLLIKTPSRISPVKRLLKTVPYEVYRITLENGLWLECADEHILINFYGDEVYAINSLGHFIQTELGLSKVISIESLSTTENMYDIEIDGDDHTYFTNGILSHNTTCAAAFFLWYASFEEHKTVLIVSNKESNATEFIHRIQVMYEYLPNWLRPGVTADGWNKKSVGFDNGCRVISRATSESSARGLSLSIVFADEIAFVRPSIQEEFWASLSPTLSTGGACIVASTPNGDMNLFAQLARASEAGTNEFKFKKYVWYDVPERDEAWKNSEIMRIGEEKFKQEHLCHFLSSEALLVSSIILEAVSTKPPYKQLKGFNFWGEFETGKSYIVGVDPSTGIDNDFSVIEVFEFPTLIQIAEFRDNTVSTVQLYHALKAILLMMEQVGCEIFYSSENNGIGEGMLVCMETDENAPEHAEFITQANSKRLGFTTTAKEKIKACIKLRERFESGRITIYSSILLAEMKNYVRNKSSYEAQIGATDDCISALLIVLRIVEEVIMYNDEAYAMFAAEIDGDYFSDEYDSNSTESAALPIVF